MTVKIFANVHQLMFQNLLQSVSKLIGTPTVYA